MFIFGSLISGNLSLTKMKNSVILYGLVLIASVLVSTNLLAQYHWTPKTNGLGLGIHRITTSMTALANGDIVICMDTYPGDPGSPDVFKSTDQGDNWVAMNAIGLNNLHAVFSLKSTNSGLVLLGRNLANESLIYKSVDNGLNWTLINNGIDVKDVMMDMVEISNTHWLVGGVDNNVNYKLYKSTNQGASWSELQISGNDNIGAAYSFDIIGNKLLITCFKRGSSSPYTYLFESTDNGLNWVEKFEFQKDLLQIPNIVLTDDHVLFALGYYKNPATQLREVLMYRSINFGDTWDTIPITGLEDRSYLSGLVISNNTLFVCGMSKQGGLVNTFVFSSALPPVGVSKKKNIVVKAYPNPFQNQVFIDAPYDSEVIITSITGQVLLYSKGTVIDTSVLPKGIYVLTVNGVSQKVIKN